MPMTAFRLVGWPVIHHFKELKKANCNAEPITKMKNNSSYCVVIVSSQKSISALSSDPGLLVHMMCLHAEMGYS